MATAGVVTDSVTSTAAASAAVYNLILMRLLGHSILILFYTSAVVRRVILTAMTSGRAPSP